MKKQLSSILVLTVIMNVAFAQSIHRQSFGTGDNAFTMEFVEIGNPGNPPDSPSPHGSVNYTYMIGKYEVSREMVNKANADGGLGITMKDMTASGGNGSNKPAVGICWNEAARFVNWLNSKEGFPAAYKFEKKPGEESYSVEDSILLWNQNDPGYDASNQYRNKLAKYFIPTAEEWYKAAFYNPGKAEYSVYPVKSDGKSLLVVEEARKYGKKDVHHSGLEPRPISSGKESDGAVYGQPDEKGPADVDNAGGLSHYGTMAQGGNVCEWLETAQDGTNDDPKEYRQPRGGSWGTQLREAGCLGSKVMYANFGPSGWNSWPGGMRVVAKSPNTPVIQGAKKSASVIRRRVITVPDRANQQVQPDMNKLGLSTAELDGHSYKLVPQKMNWLRAKKIAEESGGYLVTISSEKEQKFIEYWLNDVLGADQEVNVWIGLNDIDEEGKWKWVNGEKVEYTNWREGEPNNCGNGESCVSIWSDRGNNQRLTWNDSPMDCERYYIVEKDK